MTANRLACDLVRIASVATTTRVVLSRWPDLIRGSTDSGGIGDGSPCPPNSPLRSKGPAQNQGPSPTTTDPAAFTTASAPTVRPSADRAEAEPIPPLRLAVVAPSPAPALPSANSGAAAAAAA